MKVRVPAKTNRRTHRWTALSLVSDKAVPSVMATWRRPFKIANMNAIRCVGLNPVVITTSGFSLTKACQTSGL